MRFSIAFVALVAAVAAVSAGVYPAKTGGKGAAHAKDRGSDAPPQDNSFHLQSPDGQYVFGHTTGNQGRAEFRDKDGTVTGYYSYTDGNGQVVYVNYVADAKGYRVSSNAGVPSASVTVEDARKTVAPVETDFRKVFADFTERVKDRVVPRAGQEPVVDGQVTVDAEFPDKDTRPSAHGEGNGFPDWNQIKISTTTQKSADGIEHDEGQQQQIVVEPNWDDIVMALTTQKSNKITGNDNNGQGSSDDDRRSTVTTAETTSRLIPSVIQESATPAPVEEAFSNTVVPAVRVDEITTEIASSRINIAESNTVIADNSGNNSPVTIPVSIVNDVQTTISYDDGSAERTTEGQIGRGGFPTTMSEVKPIEEPSTVAQISESSTERFDRVVDNGKAGDKIVLPIETADDVIGPVGNSKVSDATTVYPASRNGFQTTDVAADVDFTTIQTVDEKLDTINTSPAYEPAVTTVQPDDGGGSRIGDAETTTADVQYATEADKNRGFEFSTSVPVGQIGTTVSPATFDQSAAQEQTEIAWPEIPQEPIPQVLMPLDPYPERTRNSGVKTPPIKSRLARDFELNGSGNGATAIVPSSNIDDVTPFNFPRYYLIG